MSAEVRILIVDDHEMVRRGVRAVLEAKAGWTVVGEAENGRRAVELAKSMQPDLVIMDMTMPDLNGLEATRQISQECPRTHVIVLTMHESEELVHEILDAGARGYLLKNDAGETLLTAAETVMSGRPYFSSQIADVVLRGYLEPQSKSSPATLSPREREIVQLVAEGLSSKEIGTKLGISIKTAETHRANVMRKLDIHSVSDLVRYAIRNNIASA